MIEFDYRQERLHTGEVIFRPIAKAYLGIGGVIAARFALVPMKIEKYQFSCTIGWAQIERVPFLLGRENVFEYFDITFRQKERKIVFIWKGEK
jgi:hypothetical protein